VWQEFRVEKIVLFGNGEMASQIYFYLTHDSDYEVVAFTVDADYLTGDSLFGLPVVPFDDVERQFPPAAHEMSIPISYRQVNQLRAEKYAQAKAKGYRLITYVSSKATTWPGLVIGDNCLVLDGCVVQPFVEIGNDVILGPGSVVGHNTVVEDHAFLAPGSVTLGHVRVEPYAFIGANATIRDGITVARESLIGAGVTIRRNTEPRQVFLGEQAEPEPKGSDELRNWITWSR
jgi:sugar O-acyltransferase (sialic acid O-acetyltransferase NeuD family)